MADSIKYGPFEVLAARLPFQVDDLDRVNELYIRYRACGERDLEIQVEVWTYCFVRRYFSAKLARDNMARGADLDALMDVAYGRIRRGRQRVSARYGSWVSVVCRNTFLNYVRDRKTFIPANALADLSATGASAPVVGCKTIAPQAAETDFGMALATVEGAIRKLPDYLQQTARLRILDDLEYEEIATVVNRPTAIVRAYFHKAVKRLRRDPGVLSALGREAPRNELRAENDPPERSVRREL